MKKGYGSFNKSFSLRGERKSGHKGSVHNISFDNLHASDFIRAYVKGMAEELYNMYAAFPEEIRKGGQKLQPAETASD